MHIPVFIARGRLGLTHMLSPPPNAQIPYLGISFGPSVQALTAYTREKFFKQVTGELYRETDKIAPNFVNFKTVPNFLDVLAFIRKSLTARLMFTYAIDLERSLDEIRASFSTSCKQKIKRVSAFSPEVQQTRDIGPLLDIWQEIFRERGTEVPLLSDSYLKEVVAMFPQHVFVFNVNVDGRFATASAYSAMQKGLYWSWIGNISSRRLGVNEYLEWEIISRAKSEGYKKLNLLGAPSQRISDFKEKFGRAVEPFCYFAKTDILGKIVNFAAGSRMRVKQIFARRVNTLLAFPKRTLRFRKRSTL